MAMPYRGVIIGIEEEKSIGRYVEAMLPHIQWHLADGGKTTLLFRGPNGGGYWIPEGWLFDVTVERYADYSALVSTVSEMSRVLRDLYPGTMGVTNVGIVEMAAAEIRAARERKADVELLQAANARKQKTIEEQGDKIRESIFRLNKKMPGYGERGLVGRVQIALDRISTLESSRIGDSERMGAEMSARRSFVARLCALFYPGQAIDAGISDADLNEVQRDILRRLNGLVVEKDSNAAAAAEIKAALAELKSTGHKHEGRSLSDLVDIAIDTERERHSESLERIAKALKQEWSSETRPWHTYRDWCSFLVNVITDHWQPKAKELSLQELEEAFTPALAAGAALEASAVIYNPADGTHRVVLHVPQQTSDMECRRLSGSVTKILGTEPLILYEGTEIQNLPLGPTAEKRLETLEICVRQFTAPYSLEDYAAYKHQGDC